MPLQLGTSTHGHIFSRKNKGAAETTEVRGGSHDSERAGTRKLGTREEDLRPCPVWGAWAVPAPVPRASPTHGSAHFPELCRGGPLGAQQARLGESVMDDAGQFPNRPRPRPRGFSVKLPRGSAHGLQKAGELGANSRRRLPSPALRTRLRRSLLQKLKV